MTNIYKNMVENFILKVQEKTGVDISNCSGEIVGLIIAAEQIEKDRIKEVLSEITEIYQERYSTSQELFYDGEGNLKRHIERKMFIDVGLAMMGNNSIEWRPLSEEKYWEKGNEARLKIWTIKLDKLLEYLNGEKNDKSDRYK